MLKKIFALLVLLMIAFSVSAQADRFNADHATAFMEIKFTCGCSRVGTGAMIGRRGLITAGHNLFCPYHGSEQKSCSFAFGSKSLNSAWYRYSGTYTYYAYNTFRNGYDPEYDIGYVVFDKPVGDETGYFGWLAGDDSDLEWEYINVYGYTNKGKSESLLSQEEVLNDRLVYWNGYLGGSDGGPVVVNYGDGSGTDMDYCVVAVYTCSDENGNGYGRRLTMNVINDMRADGAFR